MRGSIVAAIVAVCVGILAVAVIATDPAWAQRVPRGGPAPLIGAGLPLLGGVLAALVLVRRFRRKD
jgi:hypothetical protein